MTTRPYLSEWMPPCNTHDTTYLAYACPEIPEIVWQDDLADVIDLCGTTYGQKFPAINGNKNGPFFELIEVLACIDGRIKIGDSFYAVFDDGEIRMC